MTDEQTLSIEEILSKIQTELHVPKAQYNSFGKYKYRSVDDICEAIKPKLEKYGCSLTFYDDIVYIGRRYYVKSVATLQNATESVSAAGFAREAKSKKGMSEDQITGAASSYARKSAAAGLFAIDDTADSDATNQSAEPEQTITARQAVALLDICKSKGYTEDKLNSLAMNIYHLRSIGELPASKFKDAQNKLNRLPNADVKGE